MRDDVTASHMRIDTGFRKGLAEGSMRLTNSGQCGEASEEGRWADRTRQAGQWREDAAQECNPVLSALTMHVMAPGTTGA